MRVVDLDAALDELYAADPEDFVATRSRLAKALKAHGDKANADDLKARRKPPVAIWAVNQLARLHPEDLEALLEAGEALRRAQRKALSGVKSSGMREATRRRGEIADRLTARAAEILRRRGGAAEPHTDTVHAALVAAAADSDVAEALRLGRLTEAPAASSGLGEWNVLTLVPDEPREPDEAAPAKAQDAAARRRAEQARREAAEAVESARRDAEKAAAQAAKLRAAAREAQAALEEAETESRDAERRARKAARDTDKARRARDHARAEAEQAEAIAARAADRLSAAERDAG